MKAFTLIAIGLLSLGLSGQSYAQSEAPQSPINIIPQPKTVSLGVGYYSLPKQVLVSYAPEVKSQSTLTGCLRASLGQIDGRKVALSQRKPHIRFVQDLGVGEAEGYRLQVSPSGVTIGSATSAGFFYGMQSLLQLINEQGNIPYVKIEDAPRFAYRGLMLDVSRHFMPKEFIKSLLSEMGRYKLNRFHWHIVDGGGWRMESKAYPKLTQFSSYRTESDWDKWWHGKDRQFVPKGTPKAYGGYYTQKEIREIVDFAKKQQITIIPEIEMPGHSNELFASYPELACTGKDGKASTDVCIGSEETFRFFERILDETMALFPSEYIHIGGDEAEMNRWGDCPRCQARMKTEGLKDLHELQSYMIRRIEKYLKSKGRKLIGWDEILMGGLPADATVMSWRGEDGGIKAASAGHDVVMAPNGSLYIDYYQGDPAHEPRAIGGYVPIEKVYDYNPLPKALPADKQKHILGVQANLWTEYVYTPEHAAYMYFPRALALAEVAWTPQAIRQYPDFRRRATLHTDALLRRGVNAYPLKGIATATSVDTLRKTVALTLTPEREGVALRYTADGSLPTPTSPLYQGPIVTTDSALVRAQLYQGDKAMEFPLLEYRTDYHKAIGAKIEYHCTINPRYTAGGEQALIDGKRGTLTYMDNLWQGFTEPMDITIDLGKVQELSHIFARFMQEAEQWVYMPQEVEVWVSEDGKHYRSVGKVASQTPAEDKRPRFETFDFYPQGKARYVRMRAENARKGGYFIFTDEVVIL